MKDMSFLREDAARTEKWAYLTEGVQDEYQRAVVEQLLDNQQELVEDNSTDAIANAKHNTAAYPLIRRVFAETVAHQLVSIQPIPLPTMKLFFLDFKAGTTKSPVTKGDRLDYEALRLLPDGQKDRGKWYASGHVKGEPLGTGDASTTTFSFDWNPVVGDSIVVRVDSVVVTNYTKNPTAGSITFAAAPANGATITADYQLVMEALGTKGNSIIPEVELEMSSASVEVENFKMKAKWTIELEQDLAAYHKLSVESELTKLMARQLRWQMDRLIITDLYEGATAGNFNWSKTIPGGVSRKDHYETLMHTIEDASLAIYERRLVPATFIVCHPNTISLLKKINTYRVFSPEQSGYQTGARIATGPNVNGVLGELYTVIVDPLFPSNKILVGHKGESWLETGYVYAPYRAFQTGTFIDPQEMVPRKGIAQRAGRHLISGDFYATVTITA